MTIGQNTVSSEMLRSYVERIERLRGERKELGDDILQVKAEAKANGFTPKILDRVIKRREAKPHDLQEWDALTDMYLHALGMQGLGAGPLFRSTGLAGIDTAAKELVMERLKDFVPAAGLGNIIVNMGGKPVRLERQKDGTVTMTDVMATIDNGADEPARKIEKPPVPDVDEAGAEEMGRQFARDNKAIIDNPFPFGDKRRARFDVGWRKETGSDGMGPDGG